MGKIELALGDITKLKVDAIVNAANATLLGGGGVDGAIHRAAGPELLEECSELDGCPTGEARITMGYRLPAKYVIHTVGPVWHGGSEGEGMLLEKCYENSLEPAEGNDLKTVAFPSIITGAYHFPIELAAQIAIGTVQRYIGKGTSVEKVVFVCFSKADFGVYGRMLGLVKGQ